MVAVRHDSVESAVIILSPKGSPMPEQNKTELITLPEAEKRTGIALATLRAAARTGKLKTQKIGRDYLTTEANVDEWNSSRKMGRPPKKQD